jgi:hypothetical protein
MNFVRFSAGLARRGRSRAVARTAAARRFAVFSVALAAVLAGVALTTGPASASTVDSSCFTANPNEVYSGGQIFQLACNSDYSWQDWTTTYVASTSDGRPLYQVQNVGAMQYDNGAADCLDANAYQVYDGGAIIQWACDAGDPYQLWIISNNSNGTVTFQNYGALIQQNAADCLDADAYGNMNGGPIFQWGCNASDPYQQWEYLSGPNGQGAAFVNEGVLYFQEGAY